MKHIKIWCEYDFGGNLGGNNNEEVLTLSEDLSGKEISQLVNDYLRKATGLGKEDLEGMWNWEFIKVVELK